MSYGSTQAKSKHLLKILQKKFPNAQCELVFSNSLELLVAVILSAQATDVSVNKITPELFRHYKTALDYANSSLFQLENRIKTIGLYRNKAKNIQNMARILVEKHGGTVPNDRESLEALPGVGRKTASVVLSVAFNEPAFAVDTHVMRLSHRLGFSEDTDSARVVEEKLTNCIPKKHWSITHLRMVLFGRHHCKARNPSL